MKLTSQLQLTRLRFREITTADFGEIARYMALTESRTCDYTLGGIVLWAGYFNYRIATSADGTLYISGGREDDLSVRAYALPLGAADFAASVGCLAENADGAPLWFSAIPEDRLHLFASLPGVEVYELGAEWSDYLYDIEPIARLDGGAMKKKRNHVNRFLADNPDAELVGLTAANAPACRRLLEALGHDGSPTGRAEFEAIGAMLTHTEAYAPFFSGAVLLAAGRPVGFTIGETKGDTLHVHVEKADHTVAGANEALTSMFAARMLDRFPALRFINRQDDAGDPGLRVSKQSWRPLRLLPKFNVMVRI